MLYLIYTLYVELLSCVVQVSVLTSRKSSSTPSLNEVTDNKPSVAATDQAASADNLTQTVKSVRSHLSFTYTFTAVYEIGILMNLKSHKVFIAARV